VHGDRLAHSPACSRHLVTADCPVECLAPLLPSRVAGRLARADGRHGAPVASCGIPVTVGDVVRLYRQGRLREIGGLGPLSIREIGLALVSGGLVAAEDGDAITPECPVECLRSVISGRALNRLARADGRGVPVAPGGPPASVGDVVRRYREGRLGEIAGLGARGISEIEAGLVFAGSSSTAAPPRGSSHARRPRRPASPQSHPVPGSRRRRAAGDGGPAAAAAESGRYPGHAR
jgi:hypothetical protein